MLRIHHEDLQQTYILVDNTEGDSSNTAPMSDRNLLSIIITEEATLGRQGLRARVERRGSSGISKCNLIQMHSIAVAPISKVYHRACRHGICTILPRALHHTMDREATFVIAKRGTSTR